MRPRHGRPAQGKSDAPTKSHDTGRSVRYLRLLWCGGADFERVALANSALDSIAGGDCHSKRAVGGNRHHVGRDAFVSSN